MSISPTVTPCPQCGKHVTIPAGIDTNVQVRCPLCRAQYALADALSNMPPLLEVVEEHAAAAMSAGAMSGGPPEEWLEAQAEPGAAEQLESAAVPAVAWPHDLADAQSEEIGFALADPVALEVPTNIDHIDTAGPDEESVFDLGEPAPSHAAPGEQQPPHEAPASDEIALDFEEFTPAEEPAAAKAFDSGQEIAGNEEFVAEEIAAEEEFAAEEFSLDDSMTDGTAATESELFGDGGETIDFAVTPQAESVRIPSEAPEEEMELDFGEAVAAEPVPVEESPAAEGKQDKKKKKKSREPKAPKEGRRRPLATLVSLLLSTVIALPLTLYGLLWLSPDYDFFKIGRTLAAWHVPVPAKFSKTQAPRVVATAPPSTAPQTPPSQPAAAETATAPPAAESAVTPPAGPAKIETPLAPDLATPEPKAAAPSDPAPAADLPADDLPSDPLAAPKLPAAPDKAEEMPEESTLPAPEPDERAKPAPAEPAPEEPSTDEPAPDLKPQPVTAAKPATSDGESDLFAPVAPEAKPAKPSEPEPEAEPEPLGPINAARFTLADLGHAMQDAAAANAKMVAAQGDKNDAEFKKLRSNFYLGLFHLAEVLTLVQDDGLGEKLDAQRKQFAEAVLQFAADQKRLDALKFNAGRWLGFGKRTTPGLVVAGTVESAEQVGKLHHVKLAIGPGSDAPIVTIVGAQVPALEPGDQSLVLGVIVDNPSEQLAGYEGDEATVIWSGVTLKLPAAK